MSDYASRKREQREKNHRFKTEKRNFEKSIRKTRREAKRNHWRCFWTWPFGHVRSQSTDIEICVGCGLTTIRNRSLMGR